ncbi:hypothetical protein Hanom_Chr04g00360421 [Helianthus anomalus]
MILFTRDNLAPSSSRQQHCNTGALSISTLVALYLFKHGSLFFAGVLYRR